MTKKKSASLLGHSVFIYAN